MLLMFLLFVLSTMFVAGAILCLKGLTPRQMQFLCKAAILLTISGIIVSLFAVFIVIVF